MPLTNDISFELISQEVTKHHLELTAIIQDIQQCNGPLESLHELNAKGRLKIATIRKNIDKLAELTDLERDKRQKQDLQAQVNTFREQLANTFAAFKKANIECANAIDKLYRQELFNISNETQSSVRKRRDKQNAVDMSSKITEQLQAISRHLAETKQRSADTIETLIISSDKFSSTNKELEHQQQVIVQSGKLLGKYGRRELTDKALILLAFMFFLACVFYILQKRLF